MEFKTIFDGIRYFFEIIVPKAFSSSDWSEDSVIDAFQWVKFCEEAYVKCTGESADNIDKLLHSISGNSKHLYKTSLCFQDLQSCNTLLTQAFFENPKVEDDFIKNVIDKDKINADVYTENLDEAIVLNTLCYELIESLKPISMKNSEKSFYHDIKAEIFIDYLKNTLRCLRTEEIESQLKSEFENLCTNDENMTVFVHLLLHAVDDDDDRETEEIQQFGMSWFLLKIYNKHFPFVNFLFSQTCTKLRNLSVKYLNFFAYYVETLTCCVEELKDGASKLQNRKFTSNELRLSFNEALNHFRSLTEVDDDISNSTQQHISELLKSNPNSLVWKDMAMHVLKKETSL